MVKAIVITLVIFGLTRGITSTCPKTWAEYNDNCYWISNLKYSFDLAESVCNNYDGHLASVNTVEERDFIEQIISYKGINSWFGAKQQSPDNKTQWIWTDGSNPKPNDDSISKWSCEKRPEVACEEGDPLGECGVYLAGPLTWENHPCQNKKPFICKRKKSVPENCDIANGWHQYNGKCYKELNDPKNWNSANTSCINNGGRVIVMKEQDQIDALEHLQYCANYEKGLWIGLTDKHTENENTLLWTDGTPPSSGATNWAEGQPPADFPNNHESNCVAAFAIDHYKWRIVNCGDTNRVLCEKEYGVCEEGWQNYGTGYCYLAVTATEQRLTWTDAKQQCKSYGGKAMFMKITKQIEQNALVEIAKHAEEAGRSQIRIGLSDEQSGNVYKWSDNTALTYTKWDDSKKEEVPNRMDCGYVLVDNNPEGKWGTTYCFDVKPYVCQIPSYQTPQTSQMSKPDTLDGLTCPDNWKLYENDCYKFLDDKLIYPEAVAKCTELGAGIITIRNSGEQSFVSTQMTTAAWLGLVYTNNKWVWEGTTSQPGFKNWGPDGTDEQDTKPCCRLQEDPPGQWDNTLCEDQGRKVICRMPAIPTSTEASTVTPAPTYPVSPECGPNWVYDSTSKYCIGVRVANINWEDARTRCIDDEGGDLLSIPGPEEQYFLNALLGSTIGGASNYWIGLNELDLDTGWKWSDRSPVAYFNWADGEPNNSGGEEHCVAVQRSKENKWNDHSCSHQYDGYICKKLGASEVTTPGPTTTEEPPPTCTEPEKMVSGNMYIQDQDITARSEKEGRETIKGRLTSAGSWEPSQSDSFQYIQATFPFQRMVKRIRIFGAKDKSEWVTKFQVMYQIAQDQRWHYVIDADNTAKTFTGNDETNKDGGVSRDLPEMIYAQGIRIYPREWTSGGISMRFDVLGCRWETALCHYWDSVSGETRVLDQHFTSTGHKDNFEPTKGRITSSTGWEASEPYDENQYIQIQFESEMRLIKIRMAGRKDANRYVKNYKVKLYNPYTSSWETYQDPYGTDKVFNGNENNQDEKTVRFKAEVVATKVRIIPEQFENGKALRFEIQACPPGCQNIYLVTGPNHDIPDSQLKASSTKNSGTGPARARLFTEASGDYKGAWVAEVNDKNQWIEADIEYSVRMKGITIQGRHDSDQWVKRYQVKVSRDRQNWFDVTWDGENKTTFNAYFSRDELRTNWFPQSHVARYVRIYPTEWNNAIALRFDVQGCPGPYSFEGVGCYSDNTGDRDLPYAYLMDPSGGMTQEACVWHCYTLGYLFAGVQFGKECFCGNSYGKYGKNSGCTYQCSGDPTQFCGGYEANWVLTTGLSSKSKRCPDGWDEYGNRCYKIQHKSDGGYYNWNTALYECRQQDADLVSINGNGLNNFLQSKLGEIGQDAWIGFHSKAQNYIFEWTDYSEVKYTNWGRREPNSAGGEENCVNLYYKDGHWNDAPCGENKYGAYICEKTKESLPPATSPAPDPGCGEGWLKYRWKCYHILTQPNTWDKHKENCQGWGDQVYLARIKDNQDQAFLSAEINNQGGMFYTDLNDKQTPGTYKYTDGSSPSYTHWGIGQPDKPNEASCVAMADDDNGLWYDVACGEEHGAICEKLSTTETQPPTDPPTGPSGTCDPEWSEYGDNCYLVVSEKANYQLTWDDARSYCTVRGAELVSIHSAEENDYLWKFHIMDIGMGHWIGLYRAAKNESFKWADGSEVGYIHWADGQPGTGSQSNCVRMKADDGKWASSNCETDTRAWICKIARGKSVSTVGTEAPPTAGPSGSCEPDNDDWKFYNEKCYYVSSNKKSWYDSQTFCRQNGGYLTSIHDDDTNAFLSAQTRNKNSWVVWIGLNDIEGIESWSDGSPLDYINWAANEPNDDGGTSMCVGLGSNSENYGTWIHNHCSEHFNYICAKTRGATTVTTVAPTPMPGGCPDGYLAYRDKCFQFVDEELTWEEAKNKCYEKHKPYSLASISNRFEQAFLTSQLLFHPHTYWIGLKYDTSAKTFYWTDNTQIKYTNWVPGEPNGGNDEQCTEIYSDHIKGGKWNDVSCNNVKRYICMTYKDPSISPDGPGYCSDYGMHDQDYIEYNGDCYKTASGNLRTWQDGENHCREDHEQYGHLASVMSIYEQAFIDSVFFDNKDDITIESKYWIGLSDKDVQGRYVWSDQQTVVYTNWASNQPDYAGGGCVQLRFDDGKWYDSDCTLERYSLCKISDKPPVYTRAPSGSCPASNRGRDWLEQGVSCYMFIDEEANFADARHQCQLMNSELASVHSAEDNEFLKAHIQIPTFSRYWWIGMFRTQGNGFQWTDMTSVGYINWSPGEPSDNGTAGENCVEMLLDGTWNDVSCESTNGYICKVLRDGQTPSSTPDPTFPSTDSTISIAPTASTKGSTTLPGTATQMSTTRIPTAGAPPSGTEPLGPGAVVGIVFGVIALILLLIVIALVIFRRQQWKKFANQEGLSNPVYGTESATVDYVEDASTA